MDLLSLAAAALPLIGPPANATCGESYTVVRHDTLYSIGRRCGVPVGRIARANGIDPTRIEVGQRLVLPREGGAPVQPDEEQAGPSYRFQPGDTLYSLARWARISLPALRAANPCVEPRKIAVGDPIRLPAGAVPPEPARLRERGPVAAALPPPSPPPPTPPPHANPRDDGSGMPKPEDDEPDGM